MLTVSWFPCKKSSSAEYSVAGGRPPCRYPIGSVAGFPILGVVTLRGWPLWLGIGLSTHVVKWRSAVVDQFGKVLARQFVEIKEVVLEVPFHMLMSSRELLTIPWCTIVDGESKKSSFCRSRSDGDLG
jgi:hypothetical protein